MVWKNCLTFCKLSFHLVNCWFCYTETSDFDVVTCLIFVFIVCPFGVILKKSLPRHCFFPTFSSRSFMVSSLMSFISFELLLVHDVREHNFTVLHVFFQFSSTISWRDYSFPISIFLALLSNISWSYLLECNAGLYSVPLVGVSVFVWVHYGFVLF